MITIDGTNNIESAIITEAYKIFNCQHCKVLIVKLAKTEYSFQEAIDTIKHAKTIINTSGGYTTTYYLDGMMTAKEDDAFSYVWMFNPNATRSEDVAARIAELEEKNAMLEECVLEMSEIVYA